VNNTMVKSFKSIVDSLLGKIDTTSERYDRTAEQKQESLIILKQQLQDAELKLKEFHKMHILGDISDSTYAEAKEEVDSLSAKLAELQKQISLIDGYKIEDIETELAEIDKIKDGFNAEQNQATRKIQYELQQSKLVYLMAMQKARADYLQVAGTEYKLADVLVKMGKKNGHYVSGAYSSIGFPSHIGDTSFATENPFVDKALVHQVLEYGQLPSQLVRLVNDGKKHGYLE